MIFLKFLSALILLLSSGGHPGIVPSGYIGGESEITDSFSPEFDKENTLVFENAVQLSSSFQKVRISCSIVPTFHFGSSYISKLASYYITFSKSIDPSRDIPEIIFPFHSFL